MLHCGRRRGLDGFLDLAARTGTPIMDGLSMCYAAAVASLRARRGERGRIHSAFACDPSDFYNFGNHNLGLVAGFFGAGALAAGIDLCTFSPPFLRLPEIPS